MLFSLGSSPEEQAIYEALGALLWLQQWHHVRIDRPGEDHDSGFISRRSPTYSWEVAVIECMLFIRHNSTSCQCCQRVLVMCCSHPTFSTFSTFPIFPNFSSFFMIFPSHLLLFVFGSFHLSVSQSPPGLCPASLSMAMLLQPGQPEQPGSGREWNLSSLWQLTCQYEIFVAILRPGRDVAEAARIGVGLCVLNRLQTSSNSRMHRPLDHLFGLAQTSCIQCTGSTEQKRSWRCLLESFCSRPDGKAGRSSVAQTSCFGSFGDDDSNVKF